MKKIQTTGEFLFKAIPIAEAQGLLTVSRQEIYADLKKKLFQALAHAGKKQAFVFWPTSEKEPSKYIRSRIVGTLNVWLMRKNLRWHVKYAKKKKLFVCIPGNRPKRRPSASKVHFTSDQVRVIRTSNDPLTKIAKRFNVSVSTIQRVIGKAKKL